MEHGNHAFMMLERHRSMFSMSVSNRLGKCLSMLMEQRSPNRTHHETFLVLEEKVVALWAGIALEELFRVPVVEASVVLLLDLCALFADA